MQTTLKHRRLLILVMLSLQLLVIGTNHSLGYFHLYWYCDFAPMLFALLFYLGNLQAIKGFINIILLGQLGYVIATVTKLLLGINLMHFDFKYELTPTYIAATILIHLSALIALWATYRVRPERTALAYSLLILSVTYVVVVTHTDPSSDALTNYNFIYHSYTLEYLPYYSYLWVPLGFFMIALPTHLLQWLLSWWTQSRHAS